MKLFDSHNHLHDPRLKELQSSLIDQCRKLKIAAMVVNGSSEEDWPQVAQLAEKYPEIIPSFGIHPWYVHHATPCWKETLVSHLHTGRAAVGEIGLDRRKAGVDFALQKQFFIEQLELAGGRNLPVSIHCLKAWGPLIEILSNSPLPQCGFLIHSYSGSKEMIERLAQLGAYFSCSGTDLSTDRIEKLQIFAHVPRDRILIETDAPHQLLPAEREDFSLIDGKTGQRLNNPANLGAIYRALAALHQQSPDEFATQVEHNFMQLFGRVMRAR